MALAGQPEGWPPLHDEQAQPHAPLRCRGAPTAPCCRPGTGRIDDARDPGNEHDGRRRLFDHDLAMLVFGDEPNHDRKRRQGAPGRKGAGKGSTSISWAALRCPLLASEFRRPHSRRGQIAADYRIQRHRKAADRPTAR